MAQDTYRIGGGGGFMVDSITAVPQLLAAGVDAIIMDFLAEGAMGLFGRMRAADPAMGYSADFITRYIGPHLDEIARRGTKIVSNAGGVNPLALAARLREEIARRGLNLKVAAVAGDCLMDRVGEFAGMKGIEGDEVLPESGVSSINAYLGGFPIAAALAGGADIVVTGRVVDSALALGLLINRFGWQADHWDLIAAGTLVGHLIECGAQATGGTYTDWDQVEGWDRIGFPIAECHADGTCVITKGEGTGGLVTVGTVAEQLLYETSDPQAYIVPDVVCDFTQVTMTQQGQDRVLVQGMKGHPRTPTLKVCATFDQGWRVTSYQPVIGPRAIAKAKKQAQAHFDRGATLLRERNMPGFLTKEAILIGSGESVGARAPDPDSVMEILLKISADFETQQSAGLFAYELHAQMCGMAPGTSIVPFAGISPVLHMVAFLIPRESVTALVDLDGTPQPCPDRGPAGTALNITSRPPVPDLPAPGGAAVPLERIAFTRSGEKGETVNVGVIARDPAYLPAIRAALTPQALADWFAHLFRDPAQAQIQIYDLPGLNAINVVLGGALPGGINASSRLDSAAKSVGQQLLPFPVPCAALVV